MYEKLLKLKDNKKWLFYLLIIPFLFAAAYEFYNTYLVNSGKKAVEDAEIEDKKLKEKQTKAEEEAKAHEAKAKESEDKINNIKVDEDWHLK